MSPQHLPSQCLLLLFLLFTSLLSCLANPIANGDYDSWSGLGHLHFREDNQESTFPSLNNYQGQIQTSLLSRRSTTSTSPKIFNVDNYGAKADGRDDTEAFKEAWKEACSSKQSAIILVPKNNVYHLKPITFSGPCQADLIFKIFGTIKASVNTKDFEEDRRHWIIFDNVQYLRVKGGGTVDGSGSIWWKKSCKINESLPCQGAPTAMTFTECRSLIVANLRFLNAQQMHLTFQKCVNVRALNLYVTAPGDSPNTDGIHVTQTQNIRIRNCVIRTGDDCISIVSGSKNVEATDITCGPGHGISIGSLGADNSEAEVSNVLVNRATLSGTTNGVRIKTWQGGSGYAKNIVFQNIVMQNVKNPIIIDQNYCDQDDPCPVQRSAVQVSNVAYRNIKGSSDSEVAIKLDCSKTYPCQGILLQDVNLVSIEDATAKATCDNVKLTGKGKVSPRC